MSYLKKIGALFVSSTLMAAMLTGCGLRFHRRQRLSGRGRRRQLQHFHRIQDHVERIHPVHDGRCGKGGG